MADRIKETGTGLSLANKEGVEAVQRDTERLTKKVDAIACGRVEMQGNLKKLAEHLLIDPTVY